MSATRLAILTSHPVQYNAPAFRWLADRACLDVRVFYGWKGPSHATDRDFGRQIVWDVPLLDGYDHVFLENASQEPGTHHFRGLVSNRAPQVILEWRPDVVLVYGWAFSSHLRVMRRLSGTIPILFRGDSTLAGPRSATRRLLRGTFLKWVYKHVDVALAAGTLSREYFVAHGVPSDRVIVAPHAVDNDRFAARADAAEKEARAWRSRLGIGDGAVVFVFAGKLMAVKDPHLLLAAFHVLREQAQGSQAHLVVAGDGVLAEGLMASAAGSDNIHFIGFQNQSLMPVVYRLGDITILPSRSETWGLAVNESMACGRGVIVSDRVGCVPDLVPDGSTGIVFPAGDERALSNAMQRFITDRALSSKMGGASLDLIRGWSVAAFGLGTEQAVRRALR